MTEAVLDFLARPDKCDAGLSCLLTKEEAASFFWVCFGLLLLLSAYEIGGDVNACLRGDRSNVLPRILSLVLNGGLSALALYVMYQHSVRCNGCVGLFLVVVIGFMKAGIKGAATSK